MHANGCQPDVVTYTALISAYERGGQWLRALEAFEEMAARGCWPDAIVYNAIIDALWQTGVVWAQVRQLWPSCGAAWIYASSACSNACGHLALCILRVGQQWQVLSSRTSACAVPCFGREPAAADAPAGSFQSMLCKRQQHGSCASFYYPMLMCADVVWCTEPMLCKRQQQC
jgi:pentatricopeptide repeat protein